MVFIPDDKEELEEAIDLWLTDKEQAVNDYGDINTWNVTNVTDMSNLFSYTNFNDDISLWDVSNVTDMRRMFDGTTVFNQPLSKWDVRRVTNMSGMFYETFEFNQSINNWNVSRVTDMSEMFSFAIEFNQPLNHWNVSQVTNMRFMFNGALEFNQPLTNWDVSQVTNMDSMFYYAKKYNQPLFVWNISPATITTDMIKGTLLSKTYNFADIHEYLKIKKKERSKRKLRNFTKALGTFIVNGEEVGYTPDGNAYAELMGKNQKHYAPRYDTVKECLGDIRWTRDEIREARASGRYEDQIGKRFSKSQLYFYAKGMGLQATRKTLKKDLCKMIVDMN